MDPEPLPAHLKLLNALVQWCNPALVDAVRIAERGYTMHDLVTYPQPKLTPPDEWRQPSGQDWMVQTIFTGLNWAWRALHADFRQQVEDCALFMEGVEVTDTYDQESQILSGTFAAEYVFDFELNTVRLGKKRYVAITVSRKAPLWSTVEARVQQPRDLLRPLDIAALTDDEVLLLLEEHAKRVISGPDAKLIAPGKISLIPIVRGMMRYRAEAGQMLDRQMQEAQWLAGWIRSKVTSHQVPTASTISKVLGKEYALLRTRYSAAIQLSKH